MFGVDCLWFGVVFDCCSFDLVWVCNLFGICLLCFGCFVVCRGLDFCYFVCLLFVLVVSWFVVIAVLCDFWVLVVLYVPGVLYLVLAIAGSGCCLLITDVFDRTVREVPVH